MKSDNLIEHPFNIAILFKKLLFRITFFKKFKNITIHIFIDILLNIFSKISSYIRSFKINNSYLTIIFYSS